MQAVGKYPTTSETTNRSTGRIFIISSSENCFELTVAYRGRRFTISQEVHDEIGKRFFKVLRTVLSRQDFSKTENIQHTILSICENKFKEFSEAQLHQVLPKHLPNRETFIEKVSCKLAQEGANLKSSIQETICEHFIKNPLKTASEHQSALDLSIAIGMIPKPEQNNKALRSALRNLNKTYHLGIKDISYIPLADAINPLNTLKEFIR